MSSPKKNEVAYLQTIPRELMALILSRVAASFATDISNIKLSCKGFSEIAEDLHFYRHATLEKFPIIEWSPLCEKKQRFLKRCKESFNPEIWAHTSPILLLHCDDFKREQERDRDDGQNEERWNKSEMVLQKTDRGTEPNMGVESIAQSATVDLWGTPQANK
ncbi:hypothetical protein SASPL_156405 [Salvia splendens]|uniref:F-box domain-containing protein n=1 Tax=Salvia splendens TaxID=180675 RepID=A0A8X8VWS6_SALSN|nr:hypothetical protein SASPL_156405 [Salvia splendens]